MAEPEIRPYRPEDAEALMPFFRELWSEEVVTPPGLVHFIEEQPERAAMRAWVVEESGELVGFANARMRWALAEEGIAGVWAGVMPMHRGRGLGTRLYELAASHIIAFGAKRLESTCRADEPAGRAFAKRHGFEEGRREQYWALDVNSAEVLANTRDDATAVPLRDVRDRERELFDLYAAAERDMPDDHIHAMEFDDWRQETLANPELDLDLSAVVLADGRPASFAWLVSDREGRRAGNEMTGTAPAFRRRGLARLAKEATIRWAADAGVRTIVTSNDTTNVDMLTLNEHLGYRATVVRIVVAKDL